MEPTETFALLIAVTGAAYVVAGAVLDLVRVATRLRLGWLPSLQRTLAAAGLALTVARSVPAGAALPPPAMRLEQPPIAATASEEAPTPPEPLPAAPADGYRVRPGDSLWAIAARTLGDTSVDAVDRYWRAIYDANRDLIGADPDLIFPGQVLSLPAS